MPDWSVGAQMLTLGAIAALVVGGRLALGIWSAGLLVAAPLAVLVPWRHPFAVDAATIFPISAAAIWLCWLAWLTPGARTPRFGLVHGGVLALAATAIVTLSPQSLLLLAAVVAHTAVTRGMRSSLRQALLIIAVPATFLMVTYLPAAHERGTLLNASWWLDAIVTDGWDMRAWFQRQGNHSYKAAQSEMNAYFYIPLLVPFAAAAWSERRRWWLVPSVVWGAVLVGGNTLLGRTTYFQYSLTMQMGMLVPSTLAMIDWYRTRGVGKGTGER